MDDAFLMNLVESGRSGFQCFQQQALDLAVGITILAVNFLQLDLPVADQPLQSWCVDCHLN